MKSEKNVYAAYYDDDIRMKSSSGAIFYLLASAVLQKRGIVFGVAMDDLYNEAEYICVTEKENLNKLLGSKYMQANMNDVYSNVKENLLLDKLVLFTGTGCQINGLKNFLEIDYDNLLCVDVICHGVPSKKLWNKYLNFRINEKEIIKHVNFRCKKYGWENYGVQIETENKKRFISKSDDEYMQLFLNDYCLRPSCYTCKAKTLKMSDLTIGDFWGIDNICPNMNDHLGLSLIIIRTKKGLNFFDLIKNNLVLKKVDYDIAVKDNCAEYCSVNRPKERDNFYVDLDDLNFSSLKKKYIKLSFKQRIKRIIRRVKRKQVKVY